MIQDCHVYYEKDNPEYCILCLPGRGQDGRMLPRHYYRVTQFRNTVFVGPTPQGMCWYPMPVSAIDQAAAVGGLPKARKAVEAVLGAINNRFNIPRNRTIITGFSAGGVMALEIAAYSPEPFAAVVCHNGAILEPSLFPNCQHPDMPCVLLHNEDDACFAWDERYLPMKNTLLDKGYLTYTITSDHGGHAMTIDDIEDIASFIQEKLAGRFDHK